MLLSNINKTFNVYQHTQIHSRFQNLYAKCLSSLDGILKSKHINSDDLVRIIPNKNDNIHKENILCIMNKPKTLNWQTIPFKKDQHDLLQYYYHKKNRNIYSYHKNNNTTSEVFKKSHYKLNDFIHYNNGEILDNEQHRLLTTTNKFVGPIDLSNRIKHISMKDGRSCTFYYDNDMDRIFFHGNDVICLYESAYTIQDFIWHQPSIPGIEVLSNKNMPSKSHHMFLEPHTYDVHKHHRELKFYYHKELKFYYHRPKDVIYLWNLESDCCEGMTHYTLNDFINYKTSKAPSINMFNKMNWLFEKQYHKSLLDCEHICPNENFIKNNKNIPYVDVHNSYYWHPPTNEIYWFEHEHFLCNEPKWNRIDFGINDFIDFC